MKEAALPALLLQIGQFGNPEAAVSRPQSIRRVIRRVEKASKRRATLEYRLANNRSVVIILLEHSGGRKNAQSVPK